MGKGGQINRLNHMTVDFPRRRGKAIRPVDPVSGKVVPRRLVLMGHDHPSCRFKDATTIGGKMGRKKDRFPPTRPSHVRWPHVNKPMPA